MLNRLKLFGLNWGYSLRPQSPPSNCESANEVPAKLHLVPPEKNVTSHWLVFTSQSLCWSGSLSFGWCCLRKLQNNGRPVSGQRSNCFNYRCVKIEMVWLEYLAKCCDVVIGLCWYSSTESFNWNTWFLLFTEDFQSQSIRTVEPAVKMLLCFTRTLTPLSLALLVAQLMSGSKFSWRPRRWFGLEV